MLRHSISTRTLILVLLPALIGLGACDREAPPAPDANVVEGAEQAAAPALIDSDFSSTLLDDIKTLSSDEFGGRQPGSDGEQRTIDYVTSRFRAIGLEPANGDSYLQAVPLVEITATGIDPLRFTAADGEQITFAAPAEAVVWTKRVTEASAVDDSDVVFVGYGINAPEYDWNDYAGLDVRGKTVIILVNDPGYATGDPALFTGKAMTYYGRWTYKYEEAARQGAALALIVHEEGAAGYPFDVVQGSWTGPQFDLISDNRNMDRAALEGWLSGESAARLFAAAGEDLATLTAAAAERGFAAKPLPLKASGGLRNTFRTIESHNIAGILPGATHPDEYFIYTAHWDHLGTDPDAAGDGIYNGAVDNATGVGALLALAETFAAAPRTARSVIFLAVTAEESGLLGSRYYGEHPLYPLAQTVAGVNMDALNVHGPMRDLVVIGHGASELEPLAERLAAAQGRYIRPDPNAEKGFYYRSDHFNLAKYGIPMLYAKGGQDHFEFGQEYGARQAADFTRERYHKPADEYGEWWDIRGMQQDVALYYRLGRELADGDAWPNWYEGNEFRAIRDRSRAQVRETPDQSSMD